MDSHPRMLYRPGTGPSEVWGEFVDTRVVQSESEEMQAARDGWMRDPSKACQKAKPRRLPKVKWRWFAGHWQFWTTSAMATAGVVVGYLAIK
jgi:hypothetical protein